MATLRDKAVRYLALHVEEVLSKQNEKGEFWPDAYFVPQYTTDYQQFAFYPLAYLYTLDHPANPWKGNPRLRDAVERSFRNNLAILNDSGAFLMSSHDLPPHHHANNWRSFFWLRAWEMMRGRIDASLERDCEAGLRKTLAAVYDQAKKESTEKRFGENHNVRNHPCWYVLATYALGKAFGDEAAAAWATETFDRICDVQHPSGVWFEHDGPVVVYHHVAMSALSHFAALTGAPKVRAALDRALGFCRIFTYPSAHPIEVLDGRTRYTGFAMSILPAAWAYSPQGSAMLHLRLEKLLEQPFGGGYQVHGGWLGLPFFTQFIRDLPDQEEPTHADALVPDGVHLAKDLPALVLRRGPWTVALSGFTRPPLSENRWSLDYQAHLSIHHAKAGLIVGGGGSKRQACFSLFNGGSRPLGLPCLATAGSVEALGTSGVRLHLEYPGFQAQVTAEVNVEGMALSARVEAPSQGEAVPAPVYWQLPFSMKGDAPVVTATGAKASSDDQFEFDARTLGTSIGREGLFTISGLEHAQALLHVLPFNTHWRNGQSPREKAMGVVAQPLAYGAEHRLTVRA